jgi:membrane protein DedA with SNARE-associated domain
MVESIVNWIVSVISALGYPGIILTMAIESALIPLPSEIIMPFSGFLVSQGRFDFWLVGLCGAIGNLLGSWAAYCLGYWGEGAVARRLIRRYGKFILLSEEELDKAEKLFRRYGDLIVFGSRVIPAVRTVISLPCGMVRLSLVKFSILTFFGSLIWSYFLTWLGVLLGKNWEILRPIFRKFDIAIIILVIIAIGWYIWRRLKKATKEKFIVNEDKA